ncbi:MAG: glycosyltransferase family 2 protein [Ruminococcus sp.]|nr:glycosyltransferase family 2 protein [Ruminococcus sp.]
MVDILMAVYNGERFLREQIESVVSQSYTEWRLFICDDGSSDGSADIAEEYAERYPGKIFAAVNGVPARSACGNFMGMLRKSSAEYVMFCDQDDVWHEDKIAVTLDKMREIEEGNPKKPVLIHTDLEIVDRELNVTAGSFMRYQGLKARYKSLNRLLCQNNITGCTVMVNRALADIVKDAPAEYMLMHDWWAGLAAAAFGEIGFVDRATVKYRQHGGNQLGAVNNRSLAGIFRLISDKRRSKRRLEVTYEQGKRFYEYYGERLEADARRVLEIYADIPSHCKAIRAARLIRYGFLKQNFLAAAGELVFC